MNVKILAPAKINLGLEILDKRMDGYHNVDMIMQSVSLYDVLKISVSENSFFDIKSNVDFKCSLEDNTMHKAAECFFEFTGIKPAGILIETQKNIPSLAGLAGGSSDGAAVIVALNHIFETGLPLNDLMKIGAQVGSDVPFCINGGTARASGCGTVLNPINSELEYNLVIVKPNINISTGSAYAKADSIKEKNILAIDRINAALKSGDLSGMCNNLFNRFEDVVNDPEVFLLKDKMRKLGAKGTLMTGSGSAVFGIFEDAVSAQRCQKIMKQDYEKVFLCKPVSHGVIIDN